MVVARTVEEWERFIGEHVRAVRLDANLSQDSLARLADVSETSIRNLELGYGSSLVTLIRVMRSLGRTDWFEALAPVVAISPLDALAQSRSGVALHRRARVARRLERD
jgi:transcriptional regulator with XRE-family HTH domain